MSDADSKETILNDVYQVVQKDGKILGYFHSLEVAKLFTDWHNKNAYYYRAESKFAFYLGTIVGIIACAAVTYMRLS